MTGTWTWPGLELKQVPGGCQLSAGASNHELRGIRHTALRRLQQGQQQLPHASSPKAADVLKDPQGVVNKWLQDSSSGAKPKIHPDSPVHHQSISKTEGFHQRSPIHLPDWIADSPAALTALNVAQALLLAALAIAAVRWLARRAKQAVSHASSQAQCLPAGPL